MGKGNNENLRLSVAMCTYNGELYIKEQLESIINQALPVNEIIICDDGSTDKTISIIKDFADNNKQIIINIHQNSTNLGVVKNFEKAISLCSGDIIFFSDQDDIWLANKTKTTVDYFNSHANIELIFTNALLVNDKGKIFTQCTLLEAVGLNKKHIKIWEKGLEFEIMNSCYNKVTGATIAIRKSLAKITLPLYNNINALHDEQFAISAIVNNSIGLINKCLIKYRLHDKNACGLNLEWIKKESSQSIAKHFGNYLSPKPVKNIFFLFYDAKRNPRFEEKIKFQNKRNYNTQIIKRRIELILSIKEYCKHYKYNFLLFYISDIIYGINPYIISRILNYLRS